MFELQVKLKLRNYNNYRKFPWKMREDNDIHGNRKFAKQLQKKRYSYMCSFFAIFLVLLNTDEMVV